MRFTPTIIRTVFAAAALTAPMFVAAGDTESASETDRLLIAAQGICPVSGQKLGDHGDPIKTTIDGRTLFLCCDGCMGQKLSKEHWSTALRQMAEAQGICPVMKKKLPQQAASIVVDGRTVFVCCKPCTGKVKADPEKYLSVVNEQLEKNVGKK